MTDDTYCDKHFPLKKSELIRQDIKNISNDTFEYIKANETTYICDCPTNKSKAQKEQCYKDFLNLDQKR